MHRALCLVSAEGALLGLADHGGEGGEEGVRCVPWRNLTHEKEQIKNIFCTIDQNSQNLLFRRDGDAATSVVMITVIIPTLNAGLRLPACLDALVPGAVDGLIKEVIVADGGSIDQTVEIADGAGAKILNVAKGRGAQLAAGAKAARSDWLLFLHADTVLDSTWTNEVHKFLENTKRAGVFTLSFDANGVCPNLVAWGAMIRTQLLKLPYGDQGLLISKTMYDDIGGYEPLQLFEDVDLIQRLVKTKGARALHVFDAAATTSADRYERNGYVRQVMANFARLIRYKFGARPEVIAEKYMTS